MALWENLSKKVSGTKEKTIQHAKALTEVTRLTGTITEEKRKLEDLYAALGKQYAQLHREDCEEAFTELMTAIATSEQLIQNSQEQILAIKGVQCCANCGVELPKNAAFCACCGTPVPQPETPQVPTCSNCGAALSEHMRFCTSCGTPVAQSEPVSEPEAETEEPQEAEEPQPKVCPQCNEALAENAIFCANCGYKIG